MGIPYYFYTLTKSYDNILSPKLLGNADIYCLDFNGVIHPECAKIHEKNEEHMIQKLHEKVMNDIVKLKPRKTYICVDGMAPVAKMIQQRKRRYLSVYQHKIDDTKITWDTNAITPGTNFMQKLDNHMYSAFQNLSSIHYSGSDVPGEGEHKIFKLLQDIDDDTMIVINGLDADLIILSLMSHHKNIYLMREGTDSVYLNIHNLRKAIIKELSRLWNITSIENENDLIESYCVMCSLLGNDFIPHLLTLNLKIDGLNKLMKYTGCAYANIGLLVQNSKINYDVLVDILQQIAVHEDTDLHHLLGKYMKHNAPAGTQNSEYYALKHKDVIAASMYSNISKWRQLYYKNIFNTNITLDSTVINCACKNYIKGIYWTYAYYKKQDYDKLWYYAYGYPPSTKDLANFTLGNSELAIDVKANTDIVLNRDIQLLLVLPSHSKDLLKAEYQKYMEDPIYGLCHLYPKKYKIHTFLKTHLWECVPELPLINITYISQRLSSII
jgi:5'-3' exonuclease